MCAFGAHDLRTVRRLAQAGGQPVQPGVVRSGILSDEDARRRGTEDFARLLPDGLATNGHDLYTAYDGDETVGTLWLSVTESAGGLESFVYELAVHPDKQRRGYGRAIMRLAIDLCRQRGMVAMGLNVFGHNIGARALYDSLGFEVASTSMKLTL